MALADIYSQSNNNTEALKIYKFLNISYPNLLGPKYQLAKLYLKLGEINMFNDTAIDILRDKRISESIWSREIRDDILRMMDENK